MTASKNIGFFQVCFNRAQMSCVRAPALAFDNLSNPHPEQREYYIFNRMYEKGLHRDYDLLGAVSTKFESKANLSVPDFLSWVADNPGHDLYVINPFPQNRYFFHDIWQQGEFCHPGIIETAAHVFRGVFGSDLQTKRFPRVQESDWSYCNFWLGTTAFWEAYMPLLRRIFDFCASDRTYQYFDNTNHLPAPAPMFSFIVERFLTAAIVNRELFPEFNKLKILSFAGYKRENYFRQCDNDFDAKLLGSMLKCEPFLKGIEALPSIALQQTLHMAVFKAARIVESRF